MPANSVQDDPAFVALAVSVGRSDRNRPTLATTATNATIKAQLRCAFTRHSPLALPRVRHTTLLCKPPPGAGPPAAVAGHDAPQFRRSDSIPSPSARYTSAWLSN